MQEDSEPKFRIHDYVYVFIVILIFIPIFQADLAEFLAKKYAREHTHIFRITAYISHILLDQKYQMPQ